jgi:hypothetical protein
VEEEGCKIKGEGGEGWQWGTLCSVFLGLAVGEGDVCCLPWKEDGGAGTMGERGGGTEDETHCGGGWLQNQGRSGMVMAMGNLMLSVVRSSGEGRGYVCRELPQKGDGGAGTMGKGGGGTEDETQGGEGGTQNQGRGRGGIGVAMGNLMLSIVGSGGGGSRSVGPKLPWKEDGGARRMGKGGGGTNNETQCGGGGMQN